MNRKAYLHLAGYITFFLCLTIIFSFVNYPSENLTSIVNGWLSEASGDTLSVRRVAFRLPFSLKLGDVELDMEGDRQLLGDAKISPLLMPLLTGNRALSGQLEGPWASLRFRIRSRENGWNIDLDSLKVKLEALPLPENPQVRFSGGAEATLELDITDPENARLEGQGQLTGTEIEAFGGVLEPLGLSSLKFPSLSVFFTIHDNLLTLNENRLTGDISASARGTVRLMPSRPGDSRVDLTMDIKPGAEVRDRLAQVFSLLGVRQRANGNVVLRIQGTIERPRITS